MSTACRAPGTPYSYGPPTTCGIYVLSEEALERFPEKGDHESTAFPELASEGKLRAFRHTGLWLTVNTPKELRRADEYVAGHQEWLA